MATPTFVNKTAQAEKTPTAESTVGSDGTVSYEVTLRLSGTQANIAADWTTLTGTNFASTSALIDWHRMS